MLVLALSSSAFSWESIALLKSSTHTKIAAKALGLVDSVQYPDMTGTAAQQIKDGSTSEAGHENIHNGGGKPQDWWTGGDGRATLKGGVLSNYTKLNIKDAYLNIGRICHLTQDQAVPAHAAHIPHSIVLNLPPDGMEKYVGKNADFGAVPQVAGDKLPYEYYQDLQNDTKKHLAEWVNPKTGVPFWTPSAEASRYVDATQGPIGVYGGGADTFGDAVTENLRSGAAMTAAEIAARQLGMAAGYTKALVESASKRLPPLVSGLSVSPNVVLPGNKAEVTFTALENRTNHVKYAVTLTAKGGQPVMVLTGDLSLEKPRPSSNIGNDGGQQAAPSPEEMLFNRRVGLELAAAVSGKPLAEGTYALEVQLTDDDGNTIPASVNTDDVNGNNSVTVLSVVNTAPKDLPSFSFN